MTTTETEGRVRETWAYAGRRLDAKDKQVHAWVDPTGRELIFSKAPSTAAVGGLYDVELERHEDGGITAYGLATAPFRGRHEDPVQRAAWETVDEQTRTHLARKRAESSLRNHRELDDALEPLLAIVRKLNNRHEAAQLATMVSTRIIEAWWTK